MHAMAPSSQILGTPITIGRKPCCSLPLFYQQQPRCNEASLVTNTKNQPGTNHHKNQNQEQGLGNEFTNQKHANKCRGTPKAGSQFTTAAQEGLLTGPKSNTGCKEMVLRDTGLSAAAPHVVKAAAATKATLMLLLTR